MSVALLHNLPVIGCWNVVDKLSDETRNNTTTLANDSTLKFAMKANKTYVFRLHLVYTTGSNPDFKCGHNGPTGPGTIRIHRVNYPQGGTTESNVGIDTAYNTTGFATGTAVTGSGIVKMNGVITNGSTAGDFNITWSQNTLDAGVNTTVEAGSQLLWAELP